MALCSIAAMKRHLGLTDESETPQLTQWIAGASAAVRRTLGQYLAGVVSRIETGSGTATLTAPGHALETGDVIRITGSNSAPSVDGTHTVTRLDADRFSISATVATAGDAATFHRSYIEFYSGTGARVLWLKQRPALEVVSVHLDDAGYAGGLETAFSEQTRLTAGTDFALLRDADRMATGARSGRLVRLHDVWPRPVTRSDPLLAASPGEAFGNIRVSYFAGYVSLPDDVSLATMQVVAAIRRTRLAGRDIQSETIDEYRYALSEAADVSRVLPDVHRLLRPYRTWEW